MANLIRKRSSTIDPLSPWDDFMGQRSLRRELDRLFDDFFSTGASAPLGMVRQFVPSLELNESNDAYQMKVELPGLSQDDVQVEIDEGNVLTIRGEKKKETQETRGGYEYSERSFGQFVRTVQLPNAVDAQKIRANFENGVLQLDIPKTAAAQPRAIPISGTGKGQAQSKTIETGSPPVQKGEKGPPSQQPARH
jgi:HSP20 family protein